MLHLTALQTQAVSKATTFMDVLRLRATQVPEQCVYTLLANGELAVAQLTYGELDRQARAIAALLQRLGLQNQRVLLLYPPGLDYIAGFFGCLYAGAVAVPVYPPEPTRLDRSSARLRTIVVDSQAVAALATGAIVEAVQALFATEPALASLQWLASDTLDTGAEAEWRTPAIDAGTLAFLQYTSGSTRAPRGVMLTHGNLLHNSAMIRDKMGLSTHDSAVSWLPPYHDMGLIGTILGSLYANVPLFYMPPVAFLQRPLRWLQAISTYRATISGGPNFAYELCTNKISPEQRESLDLSCWTLAFSGAEPVRHTTMQRFAAAFAGSGFRAAAFFPCYGLAESTLMSTSVQRGMGWRSWQLQRSALEQNQVVDLTADDPAGIAMVGCGTSWPGQEVAIVDPQTRTRCAAGQVGEIWIAGPSVAQGYWNNAEETAYTFRAFIADSGEGPFLRTGDLGFLRGDELLVSGRLKDLIIIDGRNHYPQDIELTVEQCHPGLRAGCSAAFAVADDGPERLVVVAEVERSVLSVQRRDGAAALDELITAIRRAVTEQHNLRVHAVALLKTGQIPKTSSGKIQRHACKAGFLAGRLETIMTQALADSEPAQESEPSEPVNLTPETLRALPADQRRAQLEAYLVGEVARALRIAQTEIDPQQPLSALGLDSLLATELSGSIEARLGVELALATLLRGDSIAQIVDQVLEGLAAPVDTPVATAAPQAVASFPLSYGQRALWFLQQFTPASPVYTLTSAARICGPIDSKALRRALQQIVNRHAALRTVFSTRAAEPAQVVLPEVTVALTIEDTALWSEAEIDQRLELEVYRPFDLEQGPLLRVTLLQRSPEEAIVLLAVHHIVTDFWSLALLLYELNALYEAETTGKPARLPRTTAPYDEYVRWELDTIASQRGEQLWQYWQRQLSGELPVLDLPTDRTRPPLPTYCGATRTVRVDPALVRALAALGQTQGATLFMTVLAAFKVLLYRYSGQDDIIVGVPRAARRHAWSRSMGFFVNTLAIRSGLAADRSFRELLAQVRQTTLEAFEHADYPFALLVERLQPRRDSSRSPVFQVMLAWQKTAQLHGSDALTPFALNQEGGRLPFGAGQLESLALAQRVVPFDLTLLAGEAGDELVFAFEYNSDLFVAETIDRMLGHVQTLLAGIVANPEQCISDLPLLTVTEQAQLRAWNSTETCYPPVQALHHLFEGQVQHTPHAPALFFEGLSLTYHQLNARANQLAHFLQSCGVGPDVLVALYLERSFEMVIAIYAILKAGGAYLPLDPSYPSDRLDFMLADAQPALVLTQQHLAASLPVQLSPFALDRDWHLLADLPTQNPPSRLAPHHLAYVIYTSGSTGRPKGVMVSHQAIINRLLWMQEAYQLSPADRVFQKTPFSFDVSVWEFFWPLFTGAALVIARPEGHKDSSYLVSTIRQTQVTTLHFVPSMLQVFLDDPAVTSCHSLRRVICSGEALPYELQQRCFERLPQAELHNLYGPTEAAVDVSYWACRRDDARKLVPIGFPLANTRLYVLDAQLQAVPIGVTGELHIGGVQLARGYLNRPELTAEKFIADPFSSQPGARLYKTGDLARYLADGAIEYLGRLDHQVKIRGFRIELGEIEAVLAQHPQIREAVVLAREDQAGDKRLVAYIIEAEATRMRRVGDEAMEEQVGTNNGSLSSELRAYLRQRLPEYMLPNAFVAIECWPLTASGKINRQALPRPEDEPGDESRGFVAPRNVVEVTVAAIWGELLGRERVGIYDNFFELGGHSLLAMRLLSRVRELFQVEISLHKLFDASTVADLALAITQQQIAQEDEALAAQLLSELEQLSESEVRERLANLEA